MSCFFEDWVDGEISEAAMASALGGARQGVLGEYVCLDQQGVIETPRIWTMSKRRPCRAPR